MSGTESGLLFSPRWRRMTLGLTLLIAVIEGGFLALVTFDKPLMAQPIDGPLTLGLLLGTLATISGWVIACVYVVWANRADREQVVTQ
jgi:uncharacterized membrane protein (DUF485 family)